MIIAIGGGELSTGQTLKIDKFIVSAAQKSNPKLLFIPTAASIPWVTSKA
jgi:dipeptidase E